MPVAKGGSGVGISMGLQDSGGGREPHPIFGLTGVFKLHWKACGS